MSMRVLVFCSVLLHAAVCEEHCDSLDATGNTNFNEGNELLQLNADHGSSHDSVSIGQCSIEVGNCVKITAKWRFFNERDRYGLLYTGQILKVGGKGKFGMCQTSGIHEVPKYRDNCVYCKLVNVDGSRMLHYDGSDTLPTYVSAGFFDGELEPVPCANSLQPSTSESNRPQRAPVPTAAEQAVSDATKEEERAARDAATAVAASQHAVAAEARTVHDVAVTSQAAATTGPGHARARARAAQKAAAQSKINEAGKDFIWGKQLPATGPGHARARARAARKAAAQSKLNGGKIVSEAKTPFKIPRAPWDKRTSGA